MTEIVKLTDPTEIADFIENNSELFNSHSYDHTFKHYEGKHVRDLFNSNSGQTEILRRYIMNKNHYILKLRNNNRFLVLTIQDKQINNKYDAEINIVTVQILHSDFDRCYALIIDETKTEIIPRGDNFFVVSFEYNKAVFFNKIYENYIEKITEELKEKKEQQEKRREANKKRTLLKKTENLNDCSVCLDNKKCNKYFGCSHNNLCGDCFKSISVQPPAAAVKKCPLCRSN